MLRLQRKSRKLVQVALDWTRPKDPALSLGQASIIANSTHNNIPCTHKAWAVNHPNFNTNEIVDFAMSNAGDDTDFAIGAFVWNESAVLKIMHDLKVNKFPGKIILGGPQISYVDSNFELEHIYSNADVFVRGYGEMAMVKLLQPLRSNCMNGIHFRGEPDTPSSIKRAEVQLDDIASPFLSGLIPPQRFLRWETQRGCPFNCSLCQHKEPNKADKMRNHLARSRVEAEIEWIVSNEIIKDVAVLDPTFNSGPHHVRTTDMLAQGGYRGKLALQCRADMVNDDFMRAIVGLKQAGAQPVLEFGLQTIHKEEQRVIDRPTNLAKFRRNIEKCIAEGIDIEVSLIFGLPCQTVSSFSKSVEYCKSLKIPVIHAWPLMLLRGTKMHARKLELELEESCDAASDLIDRLQGGDTNIPHVVASPSFSRLDWQAMAQIAAELEVSYNKSPHQQALV